ncbi:uncharacterized protein LOC126263414 [Schistocerca nitens]|uniref:uncharacterized protein LOC126263414 n=1 Tax=Schistocerca nitens TaxID=7011 RepID=UPI002117D6F3|nr:uncharacterized protein LOC126263414 [Schistocerca nitens]
MHETRSVALPALLVLAAAAAAGAATAEDAAPYSSKYDNIDLDKVLASERLLDSYFQCLMADTEEGCTTDAKYLKEVIPDALSNGCSRCRPNQREGAEKVIKFLMKDKPVMWNKLEAKYDPEGVYRKKYQKKYDTAKREENIEPYSSIYENLNMDEVLDGEANFLRYYDCVMMETDERCNTNGKYLRAVITDALTNGCSRCSEKQQVSFVKISWFLINRRPTFWSLLEAKYDPEGTYRMRYQIPYEKIKGEKDQEPYSRKYDKVNLDEVLASERLLNSYFQCLMSDTEESCTDDAKYLKAAIPGALWNGCSRCRQRQRQGAEKVIKFLMKNRPDLWSQLEGKYDPEGVYRIKYEKEYQRLKEEQGAGEGNTSVQGSETHSNKSGSANASTAASSAS